MKIKFFHVAVPCLAVLSSCKVTQTVHQTAVLSPQSGAVAVTQSAAISKPGASVSSTSAASVVSGTKASASASATATAITKSTEPARVSALSMVTVDPVGRWTGNDQGDFVAIHFGNAGDVKFTNPDGSVSGTWQLLRDGTLQITLRNAGASFVFSSSHSGTLISGAKRIPLTR